MCVDDSMCLWVCVGTHMCSCVYWKVTSGVVYSSRMLSTSFQGLACPGVHHWLGWLAPGLCLPPQGQDYKCAP